MANEDIEAEVPMNRGELEAMVDALVIAAVEKAAPPKEPEEESHRERIVRERDERIQANRDERNPPEEEPIEAPVKKDEEMPKDRGDLEAMIAKEVIAAVERGRKEDPPAPPAKQEPFPGANQIVNPLIQFLDIEATTGIHDPSGPFAYRRFGGGSGGQDVLHPFNITTTKVNLAEEGEADNFVYKWSVGPANLSTIIDGTNGASLDIATLDTATVFEGTKYLVVKGYVSSLVVTSLEVIAVNAAALADEVSLDGSDDQDEIRLLLGIVTEAEGEHSKTQHYFTAARLTYGFLNSRLVRVFESAPTHHTP